MTKQANQTHDDKNTKTRPWRRKPAERQTSRNSTTGECALPVEGACSIPSQIGRYRLLKRLGNGTFGIVYLAHDELLARGVALKIQRTPPGANPIADQRFREEAINLADLRHPNICPLYATGEWNGQLFLVMEYIRGRSLRAMLDDGRHFSAREIAELVRTLASALEAVSRLGIVHRDVKPGNILMNEGDQPVLVDFGLACRPCALGKTGADNSIIGSPGYMSPEQAEGRVELIGPATDMFALGVVLFELLTGRRPFAGAESTVLMKVINEPSPPPSQFQANVNPELQRICMRMIAKRPQDRYRSWQEVIGLLDSFLGSGTRTIFLTPTPRS